MNSAIDALSAYALVALLLLTGRFFLRLVLRLFQKVRGELSKPLDLMGNE